MAKDEKPSGNTVAYGLSSIDGILSKFQSAVDSIPISNINDVRMRDNKTEQLKSGTALGTMGKEGPEDASVTCRTEKETQEMMQNTELAAKLAKNTLNSVGGLPIGPVIPASQPAKVSRYSQLREQFRQSVDELSWDGALYFRRHKDPQKSHAEQEERRIRYQEEKKSKIAELEELQDGKNWVLGSKKRKADDQEGADEAQRDSRKKCRAGGRPMVHPAVLAAEKALKEGTKVEDRGDDSLKGEQDARCLADPEAADMRKRKQNKARKKSKKEKEKRLAKTAVGERVI